MLTMNVCRVCKSKSVYIVHDFGNIPIADRLTLTSEAFVDEEQLTLGYCVECHHLQVNESIDPQRMFKYDYPYYSSMIPEVVDHFKNSYVTIKRKISISQNDVILEIAANDGVLLKNFIADTSHLYSVEPSIDHDDILRSLGIHNFSTFFDQQTAKDIYLQIGQRIKLILANNVLAHVPDPLDFMKGVSLLMDEDSTFILEVPYALPMLLNTTFDVIFHQHYSYFTCSSLNVLMTQVGLYINEVEEIKTQGGGFRLFISKVKYSSQNLQKILDKEKAAGIHQPDICKQFSYRILDLKSSTLQLLNELKSQGKRIIGYGAPGKAANYLNYFGINDQFLDYLVDISPSKSGKYFPNTGLKIYPLDQINIDKPDVILILTWNYADSVIESFRSKLTYCPKIYVSMPNIIELKM